MRCGVVGFRVWWLFTFLVGVYYLGGYSVIDSLGLRFACVTVVLPVVILAVEDICFIVSVVNGVAMCDSLYITFCVFFIVLIYGCCALLGLFIAVGL